MPELVVPTSSRPQGHEFGGALLGVGTTLLTKVALRCQNSCERQSATAEPLLKSQLHILEICHGSGCALPHQFTIEIRGYRISLGLWSRPYHKARVMNSAKCPGLC